MVHVQIDCEYGGTGLEPTSIVFEPRGLGDTAQDVDAGLRRLLEEREYFEVETAAGEPMPAHAATVRRVAVWEGGS
ncbi:hypothetical protein [Candidatus Palauibacter sp.]|uniref:hypothetical protein n=1 Tax=Candidatus Palauibacter sp. TaxID=3101350 RepID=UPI003CC54F6A